MQLVVDMLEQFHGILPLQRFQSEFLQLFLKRNQRGESTTDNSINPLPASSARRNSSQDELPLQHLHIGIPEPAIQFK